MIAFEVNDMTCGHCVATITRALRSIDPGAQVHADLAARRVDVLPASAQAGELAAAIRQAGYAPVELPARDGAGHAA
jgi:copper chaperone